VFLCVLRAVISAVGLIVRLNTCFYMLSYFICTACHSLCSQINDDGDDNKHIMDIVDTVMVTSLGQRTM